MISPIPNRNANANAIQIPKRVLVVGGGPTGLVSLRNLIERGKFEHVELWERRDDVGGVWYIDEHQPKESNSQMPIKPKWPSPAYKGLIGNVLPTFLSFSEFPFPEPPSTLNQPFPTLVETHGYLRAFAEPYLVNEKIKLNREVVNVDESEGGGWKVMSRDWNDNDSPGREVEEIWDAVVVAVGWYDHPVWPETEGIEELKKRGLAKHAKWYRGPEEYKGKVCILSSISIYTAS